MIVDTSAIVAIVFAESTADALTTTLLGAVSCRMSAGTLLECYVVTDRTHRTPASIQVDDLIAQFSIVIEAVTPAQVVIAREAYQRYGKGSGHRAGLNFGDCFAYALAKQSGEPLLFIGHDFTATDLLAAITPA